MRISNGNFLDEDGNEVNLVELLRTGKATPVVNNNDGHHMSAHSGWFTDENGTPVNIVALIDAAIDEDGGDDEPPIGGISINGGNVVTPDDNGIINLTISGDGSTVIDSELSASSTNPVQNKVVTGEINSLNKSVTSLNGSLDVYGNDGDIFLTDFVQGNLDNNGNVTQSAYYIATQNLHEFGFPIVFTPEDGYRYNVFEYVDGAYTQTGLISGKKYRISENQPFKLVVAKTTSAYINPSNGYDKVALKGYAGFYGWHNSNNIEKLKSGKCLLPFKFRNGSDAAGTWAGYVNYRVTNKDFIRFDADTDIYIDSGYKVGQHKFSDEGTYVSDQGWKMGSFIAKANTNYRFVIAKEAEDTSSVADLEEFYTAISMDTDLLRSINKTESSTALDLGMWYAGKPKLVAHMGYHVEVPENSIASYIAAGKRGFWAIESDVQQTSDGYYVMCHDNTVDRTTDGTGNIANLTLAEIRAFHLKGDSSLTIPTLEEFLGICKWYGCIPWLDIKGTVTTESYSKILGIAKDFGFTKDSIIFSGSKWALQNLRNADGNFIYACIYQSGGNYDWDTEFNYCRGYKKTLMEWDILLGLTKEQITQAHAVGIPICVFATDNVESAMNAFGIGADCCISNTLAPTD